jgi:hypothetical protein
MEGKRVFVPFIEDPLMHMVEAKNLEDVLSFPANKWGIPEPQSIEGRANGIILPNRG